MLNSNTPVLFLVFNRPETTQKVFEAIRLVKPQQLFIAADGARPNIPGEKELVEEVRNIVKNIDWPCEWYTLYRQEHLGCGKAVSEAINWFFNYVEKGIILEDDTLPNQSFFEFCELMLDKYKEDERIAHINGANFQLGEKWGKSSYFFSNYPMVWGWATWRRAWQQYEYQMENYPQTSKQEDFWDLLNSRGEINYWENIFQTMYNGFKSGINAKDTWDYQWIYTCWKNKWLAITPNINLVTNLGFGEGATHTKEESLVSYLPNSELKEMIHPNKIIPNKEADSKLYKVYFNPSPRVINRIRNIVYKILPSSIISKLRLLRRKYFANL